MSITYKVRFVNFDGFEFDRAPTSVFVIPKERSFECFIKELKVRAPIVKDLECPRHFKIFYIGKHKSSISYYCAIPIIVCHHDVWQKLHQKPFNRPKN